MTKKIESTSQCETQVVDYALLLMTRRQYAPSYVDWNRDQWRDFALGQLFREDDDVEYSLKDAQEIYKP